MPKQGRKAGARFVTETSVEGSGLEGIVEITNSEMDEVTGGDPIPPTTYPGQPPLPNSPVWAPQPPRPTPTPS